MAVVPRIGSGEMIVVMLPEDGEQEDWIVAVHGQVLRHQPSPLSGSNDVWLGRTDGETVAVIVSDDDLPNDVRAPLIREFLTVRNQASAVEALRGLCIEVRRPDPLFRLHDRGRRLWFDARWPLPDPDRPLRVLTGSRSSAGWTDLDPTHEFLHHVRALDSPNSLTAVLLDSRSGKWGGIVMTRGGGGRPGDAGDWVAMFNDPGVVNAVSEVQEAGIPVLAGIGHELDRTWVEEVADYSWPTPSALAGTLSRWRAYLSTSCGAQAMACQRRCTPQGDRSGTSSTPLGSALDRATLQQLNSYHNAAGARPETYGAGRERSGPWLA